MNYNRKYNKYYKIKMMIILNIYKGVYMCGCGNKNRVVNVTRNTTRTPKQNIQSLSVSTPNNNVSIQSLAVKQDLTSDERAREKKRREIILKKLGRI